MNNKKPFNNNEKPYYTEEELKIYYKIAIDESMKQGNVALAQHYRKLLTLLENGTTKEILNKINAMKKQL